MYTLSSLCIAPSSQDVTRQLLATGDFDAMTARMDEDEHSIEMHLPFVKKVFLVARNRCNIAIVKRDGRQKNIDVG